MNSKLFVTALVVFFAAFQVYRWVIKPPSKEAKVQEGLSDTLQDYPKKKQAFPINTELKVTARGWEKLINIPYEKISEWGYVPTFTKEQRRLENKKIQVEGYMYSLENSPRQSFFILSRYPVSSCFFCGGAGPESVVEVHTAKPLQVTTQKLVLEGILTLNEKEPERLFYILKDAVQVNPARKKQK